MTALEKNRSNRLPDYNTALVSDPPFSRLPSSVVIMSILACKHKLVCCLQGSLVIYTRKLGTSLCRATVLYICMYDRGLGQWRMCTPCIVQMVLVSNICAK